MATRRFNYKDDWVLKDGNIGINSETPSDKLDVNTGETKLDSLVVPGIATHTSYTGFDNTKTSFTESITIDGGDSGTLSGEVVVGTGLTISVGTGAISGQGSIKGLKVSNTFNPPIGGIADRPSAPQQGTIYYNKDFRTIEYWDGNFWRQVDNTTTSGRGVCSGGWSPVPGTDSSMEVFSLTSTGNAVDLGTLAQAQREGGGASNSIRGIVAGGGPGNDTHMEYYTMTSGGTGTDFGNLTSGRRRLGGLSSSSRAVFVGGRSPGNTNIMDYVCLLYTSPSPRDVEESRMPSSA